MVEATPDPSSGIPAIIPAFLRMEQAVDIPKVKLFSKILEDVAFGKIPFLSPAARKPN
jgi:hypothetical protein